MVVNSTIGGIASLCTSPTSQRRHSEGRMVPVGRGGGLAGEGALAAAVNQRTKEFAAEVSQAASESQTRARLFGERGSLNVGGGLRRAEVSDARVKRSRAFSTGWPSSSALANALVWRGRRQLRRRRPITKSRSSTRLEVDHEFAARPRRSLTTPRPRSDHGVEGPVRTFRRLNSLTIAAFSPPLAA
jgi:hypothetical protein